MSLLFFTGKWFVFSLIYFFFLRLCFKLGGKFVLIVLYHLLTVRLFVNNGSQIPMCYFQSYNNSFGINYFQSVFQDYSDYLPYFFHIELPYTNLLFVWFMAYILSGFVREILCKVFQYKLFIKLIKYFCTSDFYRVHYVEFIFLESNRTLNFVKVRYGQAYPINF